MLPISGASFSHAPTGGSTPWPHTNKTILSTKKIPSIAHNSVGVGIGAGQGMVIENMRF